MTIYNFTVHTLTQEQKEEGAREVSEEIKLEILQILNFQSIPSIGILNERAEKLINVAEKNKT